MPTREASKPATPAASVSKPPGRWLATLGQETPNAQAEAGWSTLKTELLPHGSAFANLEEARLEVAYYLDTHFNLNCRYLALSYRSPHQFEAQLLNHLPYLTVGSD